MRDGSRCFDEFRLVTWRMSPKIIICDSSEKSSLRIWPNNFLGKQRQEENNKPRCIQNSTLGMFLLPSKGVKMPEPLLLWTQNCKTSQTTTPACPEHTVVFIITQHPPSVRNSLHYATKHSIQNCTSQTTLPQSWEVAVRILNCQMIWLVISGSLLSIPFLPFLFVPPPHLRSSKSLK